LKTIRDKNNIKMLLSLKLKVIRYGDDFIVTVRSRRLLELFIKPAIVKL